MRAHMCCAQTKAGPASAPEARDVPRSSKGPVSRAESTQAIPQNSLSPRAMIPNCASARSAVTLALAQRRFWRSSARPRAGPQWQPQRGPTRCHHRARMHWDRSVSSLGAGAPPKLATHHWTNAGRARRFLPHRPEAASVPSACRRQFRRGHGQSKTPCLNWPAKNCMAGHQDTSRQVKALAANSAWWQGTCPSHNYV